MFWFCKPKPVNLYFYTTREEVFNHAQPKKAAAFLPDWFKSLPPPHFPEVFGKPLQQLKTIKTCPGFLRLYRNSIIFPLWSDLNIEVSGSECRHQFADRVSEIIYPDKSQLGDCHFAKDYIHAKLGNPWFVASDKKVDFFLTPPVWNNFGYDSVVVPPGIFTSSYAAFDLNIDMFIKKESTHKIYSFLLNQPIACITPLTEQKIKIYHELVTPRELHSLVSRSPMILMDLRRFARAEKLCPHG